MNKKIVTIAVITLVCLSSFGQAFQNLNFESGRVSAITYPYSDLGGPGIISFSQGLPFWTGGQDGFSARNQLCFNGYFLDQGCLGLYTNQSRLAGKYSLYLGAEYPVVWTPSAARVAQIGTVPTTAKSIWFNASPGDLTLMGRWPQYQGTQFTVTLNGQNIPIQLQATTSTYYTWAGDIRGFEGSLSELAFSLRPAGGAYTNPPTSIYGCMLDDISFSAQVVPEPASITGSTH